MIPLHMFLAIVPVKLYENITGQMDKIPLNVKDIKCLKMNAIAEIKNIFQNVYVLLI